MTPAQFGAYGGFEVIGIPAGEASDPKRHVPFAMVATLGVVMVVYALAAIVATGTLPDVAASRTPLADSAALLLSAAGALMIGGSAVCAG